MARWFGITRLEVLMHQKEKEMGMFVLQQVLRVNVPFQFSLVTKPGVLESPGGGLPMCDHWSCVPHLPALLEPGSEVSVS